MSLRMTEEQFAAYIERKRRESTPSKVRENEPSPMGKVARPKAVTDEVVTPPAVTAPTEEEEQITLFEWAAAMTYTYPDLRWLYHVPNGGSRGTAEAGRFKAMGVKPGVPDVALDIPRGGFHGLRVEMKRTKGGKLSDAQREWIVHYNAIGYRAVVCHGWQEAAKAIEEYLKEEPTP